MTITRRPPRPAAAPKAAAANPARRRSKTPEAFIEDAHHPAIPAPTIAAAPEPAPAPQAPVEADKHGKKAKEKSKGKDKSKKHKAEKGEKKDKEAVLIRFEDEQLKLMDERAADLGLSRAAWLRMVVSKALRGKKG
jgi:hypothetical protein